MSLEDEAWTAGHCVVNSDGKSPGVSATKVEFIPACNGTVADS